MSDDRIGQPMSLSQLVLLIGKRAADTQLERGDITKEEHKERIKILFPDLELVDNKAGGGMMNIDEMIKPIGMAGGGEFKDQLELEIIKLESTIKGLRADEVLTGTDNSRAIQGNQNLLEYYRSLR